MKLILVEADLDRAILNYVESLGMNLEGKRVDTTFTAGRGVNGNTVTVDINPIDAPIVEQQQELPLDEADESEEGETATAGEPDDDQSLFD